MGMEQWTSGRELLPHSIVFHRKELTMIQLVDSFKTGQPGNGITSGSLQGTAPFIEGYLPH